MKRIISLVIAIIVLLSVSPALASEQFTITYLGTEVIEENEIFNTYYLFCPRDEDYTVTLHVVFTSGVEDYITDSHWCNSKIYINGSLFSVTVYGVLASPATTISTLFMPIVMR